MADLESAAEAAVLKLKQLSELGDSVDEALEALEKRLSSVREQLEADTQALAEDAAAFERHLDAQNDRLGDGAAETKQTLVETQDTAARVQQDMQQELEEARTAVAALAEPVETAPGTVGDALAGWEAAAQALRSQALLIEQQLYQAFQAAQAFVGTDVVEDLRGMREAVEERARAVTDAIAETCATALQDKYDHWLSTLDEVETLVRGAFDRAREHVGQAVDYALEESPRRHGAALDELQPVVDALEDAAEALQGAVAAMDTPVQEAQQTVADEAAATGAGAEATTAILEELTALLARFTFVQA
jgi:ABC-type transporter Mla subunit MlaD